MEKYFEVLNPLLEKEGFTKEQIVKITEKVTEADDEFNDDEHNDNKILELIRDIIKNPKELSALFKPNWAKYLYNFLISVGLILALVFLSYNELLNKDQTGSIFGGIVGFLIGNASKK